MFNDTKIIICDNQFNQINKIMGSIQSYDETISLDGVDIDIENKIFCDSYASISEENYLSIDDIFYKIIDIDKYSSHYEILIYECQNISDITINGEPRKAIIEDAQSSINFHDDKFILSEFEIATGDLIEYQGHKWIIISEVDVNKTTYKARMRKSNYSIKVSINDILHDFDTIIENQSVGIDVGEYFNLESGEIEVTIPDSDLSDKLDVDLRFISMDKVWKITGTDKTKLGLNIFHCEKDLLSEKDDLENELAYNESTNIEPEIPTPSVNYEILIDGAETIYWYDYPNEYDCKLYSDGVLATTQPTLDYELDITDLTVVTRDNNIIKINPIVSKGSSTKYIVLTVFVEIDGTRIEKQQNIKIEGM